MPPEDCPKNCGDHSGMEERMDNLDSKVDDKTKTVIWVLGICGTVLSVLAAILIAQNSSINAALNKITIDLAVIASQSKEKDRTDEKMQKEIDEIKADIERLKAGRR